MKIINFVKKSAVLEQTSLSHSNLYNRIRRGIFPSQVKIGKTSVWIQQEINRICQAIALGYTDDQLKALVTELEAKRKLDVQ